MSQELNIEQKLADLLDTRDFQPELTGKDGRPCDADEAKVFTFDYVAQSGKNYGTMVIVLGNDNEMIIMYGDNLGKTMESTDDRDEFFEFQHQLMDLANRNRWTGTLTDISKTKKVKATLAAISEGLFEGYYGNKRTSYSGEPTEARLVINHNRVLGENDKRYRYVESLFIETADRERFKLQFTNLAGGRAMLEHVRQGGKPYDIRGSHINNMVTEMKVLNRFNRASQGRVMEGVTQEITEQAHLYYQSLRESVKRMGTPRGYAHYFESWHPAEIGEQEGLVEDIKTMFIEQTLDSRIEEALPLLARIQQQGNAMKEADIFESWINRLAEGTWELPETSEQLNKLKELLAKDLIVGPDATNARELLGGIVGDDILFDRLDALAKQDADANAWNDTEVMARLKDLGIDTSPQEPAGVEPDGTEPGIQPEQPVAPTQDMPEEPAMAPISESESLNAMRKAAGLPVKESVLTDSTGHTLAHILKSFGREVRDFQDGDEMHEDLYDALYDYYQEDMPYGTKKARDGDPYEWIADRLADELGMNEGAAVDAYMAGKSPALAHFADQLDKSEEKPLAECNMTMEGEYCPEHGLMECGGMYEMGTVAGSMAPVMGEGELDEIIDPSTATAKAIRYVGRKFAQAFPWLAVGGVGAGLAASGLMAPIVASMGGITSALSALSAEMAFSAGMAGTYAAPSIIQTIKDLFAADENSIQAGIKRWVEKYVGDEQDVQEFMLVHARSAYEGKTGFRWRAKEWPVKLNKEQAEAYLEKNDKSWLDYEKQKIVDAEKAKAEQQQGVAQDHGGPRAITPMGVPESTNKGIVINGKEVDKASLEVDGVDSRDYPDFSDAYFSAGSFTDGTPLSDEEIDQLSDQYGDLLYDKAYDSLHEGNTLLARIKSLALIK